MPPNAVAAGSKAYVVAACVMGSLVSEFRQKRSVVVIVIGGKCVVRILSSRVRENSTGVYVDDRHRTIRDGIQMMQILPIGPEDNP